MMTKVFSALMYYFDKFLTSIMPKDPSNHGWGVDWDDDE